MVPNHWARLFGTGRQSDSPIRFCIFFCGASHGNTHLTLKKNVSISWGPWPHLDIVLQFILFCIHMSRVQENHKLAHQRACIANPYREQNMWQKWILLMVNFGTRSSPNVLCKWRRGGASRCAKYFGINKVIQRIIWTGNTQVESMKMWEEFLF